MPPTAVSSQPATDKPALAEAAPAASAPLWRPMALSRRWVVYAIGIVAGVGISAAGAWSVLRPPPEPATARLRRALAALDDGRDEAARQIALTLQEHAADDPEFPGGV